MRKNLPSRGNQYETARGQAMNYADKHWYNNLWIAELAYQILGICNILFAWLGLIFFFTPLLISLFGGDKLYCNKYCGRGQLLELLGGRFRLSTRRVPPRFLRSKLFRYGFLTFFMTMFALMIYTTVLVFSGAPLSGTVSIFWTFKLPWNWADISFVPPGVAQFAFGFYGIMLTSTLLGIGTMLLFRPRSWCVYCPMGTMTQGICRIKYKEEKIT
jgi:polyferredoxin